MPRCLVGLGSNVGDRQRLLARAVELLGAQPTVTDVVRSRAHETAPVGGPGGQGSFLNAAVSFATSLSAAALHAALVGIEKQLGRQRGERWAARPIDLDLLLYGTDVIETHALVVPHPRMAFRRFVLAPAAEIAAEMVHPTTGWSVALLLAHLDTAVPYVALTGPPGSGKTQLAQRLAAAFTGRFIADPCVKTGPQGGPHSPSPGLARQIEFLTRRVPPLELTAWPAGETLAVSDFYLDQCLAYASTQLEAAELARFEEAWQAAQEQVVAPKLVVLIDRRCEHGNDFLRGQLRRLAARRGAGPALSIDSAGLDEALREVAAAVEAMR